jgi:hypothetical protein
MMHCRASDSYFGHWKPVLNTPEIVFYQMNGLMLGTWLASALEADSQRKHAAGPGAFSLAHNVTAKEAVQPTLERLVQFGRDLAARRRRAASRRLPRLRQRSRLPRLGDRVESRLADQSRGLRHLRHLSARPGIEQGARIGMWSPNFSR